MKRAIIAGALALGVGACGDNTYYVMEGVRTERTLDGNNVVTEVRALVNKLELQRFVDEEKNGQGYAEFDATAREQTPFEHVGFDYNAHGHGPPGVNDIPHVDAHFYTITNEERLAITCDGEPAPEGGQVPEGVEVNADKEPFGGCVPEMGAHGALPYDKLTADMIYGYTQGKLAFVEPMIDVQKVLAEEEIELEILMPSGLEKGTRYPMRFIMDYSDDSYEFVLTDFMTVE